jgi:hypothetical protein
MISFLLDNKKTRDMLFYLRRPALLHNILLFTEMYKKYVVENEIPVFHIDKPDLQNIEYFEVHIEELRTTKYICLRKDDDRQIT